VNTLALTSGPQYFYSDTTAQTTGIQRMSLENILYTQDVKDLPLKNFLGYDGFIGDNLKYEFAERNAPPIADSILTAATQWNTSGSIAGLSVTTDDAYVKGDVLLTADGEIVIVSAVGTGASTIDVIARADCGSTESTSNQNGDAIYIIGNAQLEGYTPGQFNRFTTAARKFNYFEYFNEDISVSEIEENTAKYGITSEYAYQLDQKTLRIAKLLEAAVLFSGRAEAASSASVPGVMCGIVGPDESTATMINIRTTHTSASTVALSETLLDALIQAIFEQGGHPDMLMMGPFQKRAFDNLYQPYQRGSMEGNSLGQIVDTYRTSFGVLTVLLNFYMKDLYKGKDMIIALQKDMWKIGHYKNMAFGHKRLPETKTTIDGYVNGLYTTVLHNEEYSGLLHSLAVS
jgi:hypothetical protein